MAETPGRRPRPARPQLPPNSYATTLGGDAPLFRERATPRAPPMSRMSLNSTSTNILWELDGYSGYAASKPDTSGTGGVPNVWTQGDYSAQPFNGYTQGPGYYGKTFFLWPPDPRTANALSGTTLTGYLSALGINTADQTVLSNIWSTWQAKGVGPGSTGLSNLQAWLKWKPSQGGARALCRRSAALTRHPRRPPWSRASPPGNCGNNAHQRQQAADLLCRVPPLQPCLPRRE